MAGQSRTVTIMVKTVGTNAAGQQITRVYKQVDKLDDSTKRLGRSSRRAAGGLGIFSRALLLMGTRVVTVLTVTGLLSLVFIALTPEILALVSATVAGGAAFMVLGAVMAGVVDRFKQTSDIVGRPANRLKIALRDLQKVMRMVMAPGADLILGALANAIRTLMPLLKALREPLTVFAAYVVGAIDMLAQALLNAGPQIISLIARLGPFMLDAAAFIINLFHLLMGLASNGVKPLEDIFGWINKLMSGNASLPGVVHWLGKFITKARRIFRELGLILGKVYKESQPLIEALGVALLVALEAVGDALEWTNRHWEDLNDFLAPIGAAIFAIWVALQLYAAAVIVATAVTGAWAAIMAVSPIGLVTLALIGLTAALIWAYFHVEIFRQFVDSWFTMLKDVYEWVTANWQPMMEAMLGPLNLLITGLEKASGLIEKLENMAPDWMFGEPGSGARQAFDFIAHPWTYPWDHAKPFTNTPTAGASSDIGAIPGPTPGGPLGSTAGLTPSTTALTLPIVVQLPDGTKLAEAIQKAIIKAQSTK